MEALYTIEINLKYEDEGTVAEINDVTPEHLAVLEATLTEFGYRNNHDFFIFAQV